jgi:hypothetical protein
MNSLFRRLYHEQEGQVLTLVAASLIVLLGMAGLSIDIGYVLHAQRELQASTDAAASAGGSAMGDGNNASPTTVAEQYSGDSAVGGVYNIHPDLNITGVTVNYACVSGSPASTFNMPPCLTYTTSPGPGCASGCNAIQVIETATVPTFFAKLFGVKSLNISATASASANGGAAPPYHIVLILDSTPSMQQAGAIDTGCIASNPSLSLTPIQCAEQGVQTLLSYLSPCLTTSGNCVASGTPGVVTNAVDQVALMTFPGLCSDTATGVTSCPLTATTLTNTTANPTYAPNEYACPPPGPPVTQYNNNPEYLILPFQSDYRSSNTASTVNYSSNLVKAVGATTDGNCSGIHAVNQSGTFYAGAIDAAQAYLTANSTQNVQNIMVLLSDGDASDTSSMGGTVGGPNGVYPAKAECQQAVTEANIAKAAGTLIYSISYGSKLTGCSTTGDTLTPCQTMEQISSSPTGGPYFFSVPSGTSTVCAGAVPITELYQVFTTIAGDLTSSRLIPNTVF